MSFFFHFSWSESVFQFLMLNWARHIGNDFLLSLSHNLKYYYFPPRFFKRDLSKKEEKNVSPSFLLFWSQINKSV